LLPNGACCILQHARAGECHLRHCHCHVCITCDYVTVVADFLGGITGVVVRVADGFGGGGGGGDGGGRRSANTEALADVFGDNIHVW